MKTLLKKTAVLWIAATLAAAFTACNLVPPPANSGESSESITSSQSVESVLESSSPSEQSVSSTESSESVENSVSSESSSEQESSIEQENSASSESSSSEEDNGYTVYFDLQYQKAQMSITELSVEYGETYTLPKPTCAGYIFVGWKVKNTDTAFAETGVYSLQEDVELVAQWKIDEESLDGWGDSH